MKFLMIYESDPAAPPPTPEQMAAIGAYAGRMIASGQVVLTGGITRPSTGVRVLQDGGKFSVIDGPFTETKELIDGYAIVNARDLQHAIEMSKEFMQLAGEGRGEILALHDMGG